MPRVVGKSEVRVDAREKVTGHAQFIADIRFGGMLHARVFRSTVPHAKIRRLDVARAQALPGVKAVVTGADCPGRIGHALRDQYPIARDRIRYWGEPVAVVIATSLEIADRALDLLEVEYEALPAILFPPDAVKPDAPLIHEALGEYWHAPQVHPQPGTNICHHFKLRRGDVDAALAQAHLVVENAYWMPWISHAQLEPHGATVWWKDGDELTVWTASQSPFFVRHTLAELFGLSPSRVRVITPYIGGGFGGKSDVTIEPLVAVAARAVPGQPVQLILTREEMFAGTVVGRGAYGHIKTAVDAEGNLIAAAVTLYFGAGGYADYAVWICQGGGHNATGPYEVPNLRIDSYEVYTNTPPTGAFRGYAHPELHWMVERQMDIIARRLGMSPAELRLRNCLTPGRVNALGQTVQPYNGRIDLCIQAVWDALGPEREPETPGNLRGRGIAAFMKSPVMRTNAQSGAIIRFNDDGSVNVITGAVELGQGVATVMTQIAAEALGLPVAMVHYASDVDTEYAPHEWQTVASHTTWAVGNAVRLAAQDAICQLKNAASMILDVPIDELEIDGGQVFPRGQRHRAIPYADIALGYTWADGSALNDPIVGRGTFVPRGVTHPDPETGQGNAAASWTFGCQAADVEIDPETGQVRVHRLITALDPGRVLNPPAARGQVLGAMAQALGAALLEKIHYGPDGRILNHSLVDYRIPTSTDMPEMEVIFIETPDEVGPYGARGLGEHGAVAIPPAIANAIANASGIDLFEIPLTPEAVLKALEQRCTQ